MREWTECCYSLLRIIDLPVIFEPEKKLIVLCLVFLSTFPDYESFLKCLLGVEQINLCLHFSSSSATAPNPTISPTTSESKEILFFHFNAFWTSKLSRFRLRVVLFHRMHTYARTYSLLWCPLFSQKTNQSVLLKGCELILAYVQTLCLALWSRVLPSRMLIKLSEPERKSLIPPKSNWP